MRNETAQWLNPMMQAAEERDIDFTELIRAASMPAAEADSPAIDALQSMMPEGVQGRAVDWVRFGWLLRHELGWGDTYPDRPQALEP